MQFRNAGFRIDWPWYSEAQPCKWVICIGLFTGSIHTSRLIAIPGWKIVWKQHTQESWLSSPRRLELQELHNATRNRS